MSSYILKNIHMCLLRNLVLYETNINLTQLYSLMLSI